ncbi:hypothetical protein WJ970_09550 [Achromobacter xylosoxidans]
MAYDARGNQIKWSDSLGNLVTRSYDSENRLLTETAYSVPASNGKAASGELVTRNVYDAAGRLRFQINPVGNVTEHRYNGYGERTSTLTYAGDVYPIRALALNEAPTEASMQAWASAADMSRVSRVDAVYDYRGMLQQTTAYRSVNASGDGVLDGEQAVTRYVYDRSGRLISTVTPTGGATSYVYDGMGRVISVQNALGQTTLTQYDDVGNRMTLTQANGLRTVSVYDKAGQKISQYEQSPEGQNLGETRYVYDVLGRLRITTDPAGRQAFIVYDEAGRKTGDVDVNGILTEYQYNSQGRLWRTNTYSAKVDISNLVDAQGKPKIVQMGRLIPTGEKSSVWNFYDAAGRLAKTRMRPMPLRSIATTIWAGW